MRRPNEGIGFVRMLACALTVVAFAGLATAEASAQQLGAHPGEDAFSVAVQGGGFFSGSSFAGGTRFDDAGSLGVTGTWWTGRNLGIRANVLWSNPDVVVGAEAPDALVGEDPDVFHWSGDVILRMPMPAGDNLSWFPYLVGGIGGKTYDFETLSTDSDFTGNVGLGLELRFGETGRWGVNTEVRDFISNFDRVGVDETLHDVMWTAGLSVNF